MSSWKSSLFVGLVLVSACKEASPPLTLTTVVSEPAGMNCAGGGVAILVGPDTNADGSVSASEATKTSYVCNGASATPTPSSLVRVTDEAAGDNCEFGGVKLSTGPDTNGNGVLDESEATAAQYVCTSDPGDPAQTLLEKTPGAPGDERCPGGYVRLAFGVDDDASGTLEAGEEDTVFATCNLAPRIEKPQVVTVPNCAQATTLPLVFSDVDGTVASVTARVLASGSTITVSVDAQNRVIVAGGMHVGGAVIEVTATDDLGGRTTTTVLLSFTGTGCTPDLAFYGVQPETCVGLNVNDLVGDDRSGAVLTSRGVYYNADFGLVRVTVNAAGGLDAGVLADHPVDTLMGDSTRGELLSLWSSSWTADGGTLDAGLLDAPTTTRGQGATFDQLAAIDETTFQPTRRVTLPVSIGDTFTVTDATMMPRTFNAERVLLSAVDGHALIAQLGYDSSSTDTGVRYLLVDTTTGMAVVDRSLVITQNTMNGSDWQWRDQEDEDAFQHFALTRRGTTFWLTYLSRSSGWYELELAAGTPVLRSETFGTNCDLNNLALTSDGRQAWFHTEGRCFEVQGEETIIRCNTLFVPNIPETVDDRGNPFGNEF